MKNTGELFTIIGNDGWTKFEESNAQKIKNHFFIKEWYGGYYLRQDNCLCKYGGVIAENCAFYDLNTDSYYALNDDLYNNLQFDPNGGK